MQLSFNCHSNTVIQLSCHSTVIQLISKFNCHSYHSKPIQLSLQIDSNSTVTRNRSQCHKSLPIHSMSTVTRDPFNVNCHSKSIQFHLSLKISPMSKLIQFHLSLQIESISHKPIKRPCNFHFHKQFML